MKKPSGRDAHLAEMKFAVNSTWNHNVWRNRVAPRENAPDWKKIPVRGVF